MSAGQLSGPQFYLMTKLRYENPLSMYIDQQGSIEATC